MGYSQNSEEKIILDYFKEGTGYFLDIGANDGKTLSNTLRLAELGWAGVCVEPDEDAFEKLVTIHEKNDKIFCYNFAITDANGEAEFFKSGTHLNKGDVGLLGTFCNEDYEKWKGITDFTKTLTPTFTFQTFMETCPVKEFDFISVDIEGMELRVLPQMNLLKLGCKLLCVEWNGKNFAFFDNYCKSFGMNLIHQNQENLIYAR